MRFEPLIYTYSEPLYRIFLRMTQQEEMATLFLNEVFIKAYKLLPQYDEAVSLKVWLYRIAIQHWRQQQRVEETSQFVKMGREQQLEQLIARLPETGRLIFLLRYGGGCSYEEIAVILSMPVEQVKERFDKTKQKMRSEVREARS